MCFLSKITACCLLSLICFHAWAQDTVWITSPVIDSLFFIDDKAAYFIDSTNELDLNEIAAKPFRKTGSGMVSLEQAYAWQKVTAWARWYIANRTGSEVDLFFVFPRRSAYSVYREREQVKKQPGFYTSQSQNEARSTNLLIRPGEVVTLYAQLYDPGKNRSVGAPFLVSKQSWESLIAADLYEDRYYFLTNTVFIAIIFFIIIHTLALYYFNRRKEFLLYAFYGFTVFNYFVFKFDDSSYRQGEDVIVVPAVSTGEAVKKFPKGIRIVKPYLRYTPQPNL